MSILKFEIGKTYETKFIGDCELKCAFIVESRTDKTVTLSRKGETGIIKRKIFVYENCENVKPLGNYSMCIVLGADNLIN